MLNEPSVVAIDKNNGTILATGAEAKEMLGRTPNDIAAIRPLKRWSYCRFYSNTTYA